MGCSPGDAECYAEEKPAHRVVITRAFELGKYLVTQAQYEAVTAANRSYSEGRCLPVAGVRWDDAQKFCLALNGKRDGYHYRLPTEAEWEYAARAGDSSCRYGPLVEVAWFHDNSGGTTHPVGRKRQTDLDCMMCWETFGNGCRTGTGWTITATVRNPTRRIQAAENFACRAAALGVELRGGSRASPLATPSSPVFGASWSGSVVRAKWSPDVLLLSD
jgi:formylglycine-generating enzyme required for sulfatase activity